jgi:hypothetical protein
MRITKKITKEVEVTEDILCNSCGESMMPYNDEVDCVEGIVELEIGFGYFSERFPDGERIRFSMCEFCLYDIVSVFVVSPEV